jgi:adenosine deaminase/aminodeoxyfutalosine deaminase
MAGFVQQLPKAELHLHLEGSVEPRTMQELAPELSSAEIDTMYHFTDFPGFLQAFKAVVERLRTPDDYALVARRMTERLARQNVRYAEVIFSLGVVLWKKQEPAPIFHAIRQAVVDSGVEIHWIVDAIRHFGPEHVMQVAEQAAALAGDGASGSIVAFGIGGDEARGPAEWFADVFRFARAKGLRLTAHAGEAAGPESVWKALEIGAERIGHGIRSVEDPVLVRHLADHNIPLEISITSNLMTGVVSAISKHPVRQLYDAGVAITLNTDDPGFFRTTLCDEYELAAREFGFGETQLREIAQNGFRYAFQQSRVLP